MKLRYSLTSFAQSCCCEYKFSKKSLNYHFTVNETVVTQTLELSFHRHQNCRSTDTRTVVPQTPELSFHRHQNCHSTDTRTVIPQTLELSFYSLWRYSRRFTILFWSVQVSFAKQSVQNFGHDPILSPSHCAIIVFTPRDFAISH